MIFCWPQFTASLAFAPALLAAWGDGGGGSGGEPAPAADTSLVAANMAVLIAAGDATSEAIGRAYQLARGIPEANMVRVPVAVRSDSMPAADFITLKAAIDARLPARVQATLVTWTRPSRVTGTTPAGAACSMGITSALALGYDTRYCGGCVATAATTYYGSSSHRPFTDHGVRPSMMLGAATLADAQVLIKRGLAAEGTWAKGSGNSGNAGHAWLVRTSDAARSVRADDFRTLAATTVTGLAMHYVDNASGGGSDVVVNQARVMFYFTGLVTVPQITSNSYLPGAVADHLTSSGGALPDGGGQMPATAWLAAGLTGSYGTVEEPCNFTEKFPRASVLVDRYQGGDTLIEAYWKSVRWPGQGLFVGEPLARPWVR